MRKLITLLALCCAAAGLRAQSVGINTAPAASAALDVASQTKGMLVPRMNTTARNAIVSPQKGLMVFDSLANNFYYYNGTAWTAVGGTGTNIYNADGTLSAARTVTLGGNTLDFAGTGNLGLNDNGLRLRGAGDGNHALQYNSTADGPVLTGFGGGRLASGTAGGTTNLAWSSSGVTVNGGSNSYTLPTVRGSNGQGLVTNGSGGTNWGFVSAAYPNVELSTAVASSQAITQLGTSNTYTPLVFSSSNGTGAALTGGNTWNGSVFTVGSTGTGTYQVTVQMTPLASTNVGVYYFLDKNNTIGNTPTTSSTAPYALSTYNLNSSGTFRFCSTISTVIYLVAGDQITLRAQSISTSTTANTNPDGSNNLQIVRLR